MHANKLQTFPSVRLPSHAGGLPVEVSLIAQLGPGGGDRLIAAAVALQRAHPDFVDALDEPSARLGGMDLDKGDATSLYSFAVGAQGHPFHRHAGHRVFTAVSGSGGVRLRFSTASPAQIAGDPRQFVQALRHVDIAPDCMFTVRFGGDTWHQFVSLRASGAHPAMFALSCHTNELGGALDDAARARISANAATIPSLTELLPAAVSELLADHSFNAEAVPTVALSLHAPPASRAARVCAALRGVPGRWRTWLAGLRAAGGYRSHCGGMRVVLAVPGPSEGSLLQEALADGFDHADGFQLVIGPGELGARSARSVMGALLEGFVDNAPAGVSRLMALRNGLVRPFGLRTSPLGCPVSSLLSTDASDRFASRFPVLAQRVAADDSRAQVLLGADDKHLQFRSCVDVEVLADGSVRVGLGTRVRTRNVFGRFYMGAIERVHRRYVSPAMLRMAADHAVRTLSGEREGVPVSLLGEGLFGAG